MINSHFVKNKLFNGWPFCPTTVLCLSAAPARAGIVPADTPPQGGQPLTQISHNGFGVAAAFGEGIHQVYRRPRVREKTLESLAKIIHARLTALSPGEAVLGAAAVANVKPWATAA